MDQTSKEEEIVFSIHGIKPHDLCMYQVKKEEESRERMTKNVHDKQGDQSLAQIYVVINKGNAQNQDYAILVIYCKRSNPIDSKHPSTFEISKVEDEILEGQKLK